MLKRLCESTDWESGSLQLEKLPRHFVEKPWGQAGLPAHFGGRAEQVGEIWFDRADAPLPLLCKWLFTSEKLSVQVHPNDGQARERGLASGKEECWIVTSAEEGATLGIGLKRELSGYELREASLSGAIEELLDWKPVKPGDWYYIPSGTVHAIGAGVQLVEIQQNADITYRLYDYGRPRELHLDDGVAVSRPAPYAGQHGSLARDSGVHELVSSQHFRIDYACGAIDAGSFAAGESYVVPVAGEFVFDGAKLAPGEVAFGDASQLSGGGPDSLVLVARA